VILLKEARSSTFEGNFTEKGVLQGDGKEENTEEEENIEMVGDDLLRTHSHKNKKEKRTGKRGLIFRLLAVVSEDQKKCCRRC